MTRATFSRGTIVTATRVAAPRRLSAAHAATATSRSSLFSLASPPDERFRLFSFGRPSAGNLHLVAPVPVIPPHSCKSWSPRGNVASVALYSSSTHVSKSSKVDDAPFTLANVEGFQFRNLKAGATAFETFRDFAISAGMKQQWEASEEWLSLLFMNDTMVQVLAKWESDEELSAVVRLQGFDIPVETVKRFRAMMQSPEERLIHSQECKDGIIALCEHKEVDVANGRYTPVNRRLLANDKDRTLPVYMILGSSGSGKTLFALKDASKYKVTDRMVTLYLHAEYPFLDNSTGFDANGGATIVDWIRMKIERIVNQTISDPLSMHLSIVIDEAGATGLYGFFEKKAVLNATCARLETLATSTRLIVCGTGLTGSTLCSKVDVRKIRMKKWRPSQLEEVLASFRDPTDRGAMEPNDIKAAVRAIGKHPALGALATNARSTYYLFESIRGSFPLLQDPVRWVDVVHLQAARHLDYVVTKYIQNNALSKIAKNKKDRFLVAAAVFRAVENGINSQEIPTFLELPYRLRHLAVCLVELNVDFQSGSCKFQPLRKRQYLSIQNNIGKLRRDLNQQERRKLDNDIELAFDNISEMRKQWGLVRLVKAVPEKNAKTNIQVPMLGKNTIWINGLFAPFADVVAYYTLYHCKHCAHGRASVTIDLEDEVKKCGLLKECKESFRGRLVLRALLQKWESELDNDNSTSRKKGANVRKVKLYSEAFPENLLDTSMVEEDTVFDLISYKGGVWKMSGKPLPAMPKYLKRQLRFVISTNTDRIKINIGGNTIDLTVEDGKVNMEKLHAAECYSAFLNEIVAGVVIEFLIT